jgi:hypothetical protein
MPRPEAARGVLSFAELERSIGKTVVFMYGKNLHDGTLVGVDSDIFSVTVRATIRGRVLKIRLQLPKLANFALVEQD